VRRKKSGLGWQKAGLSKGRLAKNGESQKKAWQGKDFQRQSHNNYSAAKKSGDLSF
jgi:hypothetical protein